MNLKGRIPLYMVIIFGKKKQIKSLFHAQQAAQSQLA